MNYEGLKGWQTLKDRSNCLIFKYNIFKNRTVRIYEYVNALFEIIIFTMITRTTLKMEILAITIVTYEHV